MNSFIITILAIISVVSRIDCVQFTDCGSVDGKVSSVTVAGCSASDARCQLKVGTDASIDIQFTSNVDSKAANVQLWGVIGGAAIPFAVKPSGDACANWGVKCPISNGDTNKLKVSMHVADTYPKIKFNIRIALKDSNGKYLVCQEIPAQITSS